MKNDILLEILKYIAIFFASVFLPKKLTYFVTSFISYLFKSIIKNWYYLIISSLTIVLLYYCKKTLIIEKENINYKIIMLIYFISFLFAFITSFTKFIFQSNAFFSIYPTYTIKDNEFIVNDIESEKLNEIINLKIFKLKNKFYVFRTKIVDTKLINIPQFFPIIIGYKNYLKFIEYKLNSKNPISFYIQKDLLDFNLRTRIFLDKKQFRNIAIFDDIEELNLEISKNQNKTIDEKIESTLFLFFFINSQIFLDQTLDEKLFDDTIKILNDLEEQLVFIKDDLISYEIHEDKINAFYNVWKALIKRYYSIIYIEQQEYKKAVDFIIESNYINPFFPQDSYEKAKHQYINNYLLDLIPQIQSQKELLQIEFNHQKANELISNIYKKLEYETSTPNYKILAEIIKRNNGDEKIVKYIEQKLSDSLIGNENIFSLLFIAESYKFSPLGIDKYNEIYINRIPTVIEILEKIINLDSEFEIIHLKIGVLKFMYAHSIDEEIEVDKSLIYMKNHMYLYKKYGLI
ncbi:hypothetical protein [Chryseobacterium polytrichastri]|uniref:Uncharacterized protein n=1 Tax=Chryseobacterium polytrichastri TaxID=1302687 RepID=A0A1M6S4H2_9FLAO|nr:hypothetical protein [Chryseobacterium polytrichastri]SHK39734.1 hypothetical protein SAMN05444267_1003165 [Chryseobacterium polytrichastri]